MESDKRAVDLPALFGSPVAVAPSVDQLVRVILELGPDRLEPFLRSEDPVVSSRALHVFSELGRRGSSLSHAALIGLRHERATSRWHALDGLLRHTKELATEHITAVLELAADPDCRVRRKVSELIAAVDPDVLAEAAKQVSMDTAAHVRGVELQQREVDLASADRTLEDGSSADRCYLFARFLRETADIETWAGWLDQTGADDGKYFAGLMRLRQKMRGNSVR